MSVIGVIPARLQSTRLPRKLLLDATGKPLLQYAWEVACDAGSLDSVVIAADSEEIVTVARSFGAEVQLTGQHPSGTDRVAEVARSLGEDCQFVVNIQGDEPDLNPESIDLLVEAITTSHDTKMATLATPIRDSEVLADPSCVKLVCDNTGRAMYFSRSPIPFVRDGNLQPGDPDSPWLLHLGVYAYRRDFLLELAVMPPSRLEQLEKLEQLRALEAGARLQVGIVDEPSVGIDTRDDYARFVARQTAADSDQLVG
ncbi:MAG: 3-deoxy-manno-octulosonate cytidylyltransferase [Planctomycetaceae bacterium]